MKKVLAIDIGASSGRAVIGCYQNGEMDLIEIHRFKNEPVFVSGHWYWDILRLILEVKNSLIKAKNLGYDDIDSIGIDTWGSDYGLIDKNGKLLCNPYHYRDTRTDSMMSLINKREVYEKTGIHMMWFNTIFQFLAEKETNPHILGLTHKFLLLPDLLNYFLTGKKYAEYSVASTTQLLSPYTQNWDFGLIEILGLPAEIFPQIVDSGTEVGRLTKEVQEEIGLGDIPVIAVASHDTASAVVAVPMQEDESCCYISSGTWSLFGIESNKPIINEQSFTHNFTNEGGYNRTVRFIKNVMGLWLVQECKKQWEKEGKSITFEQLSKAAMSSEPFAFFIDPDFEAFKISGNMPLRITEFCKDTNQNTPGTEGAAIRCIMESLAFAYRRALEDTEKITGKSINSIHIVGGGVQDELLCQFTANATGKTVMAGPVEATAIGNIVVQLLTHGAIQNIGEARKIIKNSFPVNLYEPENKQKWDEEYERFMRVISMEKRGVVI